MSVSAAPEDVNVTQPPQQHPRYYFEDGTDVFLVEQYLYRLHRGVLSSHSHVFADMYKLPQPATSPVQGCDDENPIVLHGVASSSFDHLLCFVYLAKLWSPPPYATEMLVDVLSLSAKWGMTAPRDFALHFLEGAPCSPILRIHLAVRYGVPRWIPPAFRELVYGPINSLRAHDLEMITTTVSTLYFKVHCSIDRERKWLAAMPTDVLAQRAPSCKSHVACGLAWADLWKNKVASRLTHHDLPIRCDEVIPLLEAETIFPPNGMSLPCYRLTMSSLKTMDDIFSVEDELIAEATVCLEEWCRKYSPFSVTEDH